MPLGSWLTQFFSPYQAKSRVISAGQSVEIWSSAGLQGQGKQNPGGSHVPEPPGALPPGRWVCPPPPDALLVPQSTVVADPVSHTPLQGVPGGGKPTLDENVGPLLPCPHWLHQIGSSVPPDTQGLCKRDWLGRCSPEQNSAHNGVGLYEQRSAPGGG